ncbi:RNA polymerase sigma factor region1.1 domain-containing protein [Methylobacterium oryzisoli]|uniref:RNA polymerase sigma factor region1.1 domain-containing protein n=1 Tax=Methylobacterium oryzisoli TaxID=3385502 RepID=UPI003891719B
MPPSLDRPTLDRLIAKGREQRFLTTADLRGALPIAAMSPDDIALVVIEIEEAGVPVELDEGLLAEGLARARPPGPALPEAGAPEPEGPPPAAPPETAAVPPAATPAPREGPRTGGGAHRAVVLAFLAAAALVLAAVLLLRGGP